jgi:hypothetical protein
VDAGGDDLALPPLDQFGHPVERAGLVGEEQAGALELLPADIEAVLQVLTRQKSKSESTQV